MHGLVICAFESFVQHTYGPAPWCAARAASGDEVERFEAMFHYEDALADRLLAETARALQKPPDVLLEDFGTFLVAHPASDRVRRLLRFGGGDYEDFLSSLEDLSGRARLAVPDLRLPELEVDDLGRGEYRVRSSSASSKYAAILAGLLRALADDYGALALVEVLRADAAGMEIGIGLLEPAFAAGRGFRLAQRAAG